MEPDKVGYSLTFKVGLPNYGSADVQVSASIAKEEGESLEEAYERVKKFVSEKAEAERQKLITMQNDAEDDEETQKSSKKKGLPKTRKAKSSDDEEGEKPKSGLSRLKKLKAKAKKEEEEPEEEAEEENDTEEEVEEQEEAEVSDSVQDKIAAMKAKYGINKGGGKPVSALKR